MVFCLFFLLILLPIHAWAVCDSNGEWEFVTDDEGVEIYRCRIPGSPIYAVRGIAEVKAPIDKIFTIIKDVENRKEWVDYVAEAKVVKALGPGIDNIQYVLSSPPWPISDRDAVFESRNRIRQEENEAIIETRSVDIPEKPVRPGIIRIAIQFARIKLKPIANGAATRIIAEMHADPKGWLPSWIVNYIYKSWPKKTVKNLTKQANRSNLQVPERIERFLLQIRDR